MAKMNGSDKRKERWQNNLHPEEICCGRKIFNMIDNCKQMSNLNLIFIDLLQINEKL
jgi:hypothetical protein